MSRRGIGVALVIVLGGCSSVTERGGELLVSEITTPPPSEALPPTSSRPDGERAPSLRGVDAEPLFEGDIKVPRGTWGPGVHAGTVQGAGIAGKRWPNRTVPYVFASNFAYKQRALDAIAHWEAKTVLRFVPRTTEADYIRFAAGHGCSAHIGRQGGVQEVELAAGEHITNLVGVDFARADGKAHYFWWNGYRTVGRSSDPDEHETHSPYVAAAGKTPQMIADVAFASNGAVYTWYRDGTYSIGTPSDLGATQAAQPFALPGSRTANDIAGVAMAANGHVFAWYADGTVSEGTATDLAAHKAPQSYVLPPGRTRSELLGFGIANDGYAYAWYSEGKASAGATTDLNSFRPTYTVKWMGHCGVPQAIHELGHAVGMFHEQTRLDRDTYITINWSNILSGHSYNFDKHGYGTDHGAYDYDSIMHYDSYAFSANGQPTIVRKTGGLIDDPSVLSAGDITSIAAMYP